MSLSRRGFLASLDALSASGLLAPEEPLRRIWALGAVRQPGELWNDGIHDDWAALQWRMDNRVRIPGGLYLVSRTLILNQPGTLIQGSYFLFRNATEDYFLRI